MQLVSARNLKSFTPIKTDLWAKEVGEISVIYNNMGKGLVGILLPTKIIAATV